MTILSRYLIRQNIFLLMAILIVAIGVFLLADLFDRMDAFLRAGIGFWGIIKYFTLRLPSIVSQLIPAVFLMALVIQLNILSRTNEMVALRAGGISPFVIMKFIIKYGFFWACAQLVFSQALGVEGDRYAASIWREEVRGRYDDETIDGLWFTEQKMVIHLDTVIPLAGKGSGFLAYELADDGVSFKSIIQAKSFIINKKSWTLYNGTLAIPASFTRDHFEEYTLPIKQDLQAFAKIEAARDPKLLPLWELRFVINRLKNAGSNVEAYLVAWHAKMAYAASVIVMGIFALAISLLTQNIYKAIGYSLLIIFLFFAINKMAITLSEQGIILPFIGGWFADIFAFLVGVGWLIWPVIRQKR